RRLVAPAVVRWAPPASTSDRLPCVVSPDVLPTRLTVGTPPWAWPSSANRETLAPTALAVDTLPTVVAVENTLMIWALPRLVLPPVTMEIPAPADRWEGPKEGGH